VAAPRHLRRRRLHGEIPDALLVPGAELFPLSGERPVTPKSVGRQVDSRIELPAAALAKRKRTIALIIVILVTLSIPALVLALIFTG
jgi:hypothetical protein